MLRQTALLLLVITDVLCQIDGEFWWLHNDISKLKHGTAPPPKFDDVNELDTDETAKVVFRDSEDKKGKFLKIDKDTLNAIHFRDETELAKPFQYNDKLNINNKFWEQPLKSIDVKKNSSSQKTEDEFRFVFPSNDNLIWTDNENDIDNKKLLATGNNGDSSNKISTTKRIFPQNSISSEDKNPLLPENICTFIAKSDCLINQGTLYEPWMTRNVNINIPNTYVVCCILPISTTLMPKIIFPDNFWGAKRDKRSNADDESPALKQRNTLMKRKHTLENQRVKPTIPSTRKRVEQKITNSDEYPTDPYWNIKNSNIRNPDTPSYLDPDAGSDYESQNYGDDYTAELPKPGLLGLYSDHKQTQSAWTHNKNKGFYYDTSDSVEEEFEPSFGYSNIDPRRDPPSTSRPSKRTRPRPLRLSASTSRVPETTIQDPTITYHSNPDFHVLQGFKLLNLMQSKNRYIRTAVKNNKGCADSEFNKQENPSNFINYFDNYEGDLLESNLKRKLFSECGKTQINHKDCERGLKQGIVEFGGHPWITLVVLTKSENSILCYATLVHSRVAVSSAHCVAGKLPGAVSIVAGVQTVDKDLPEAQRRMVTITLDADYTPDNLEHSLALLHWLRPLIFDAKVQPACLGDMHSESKCVFVGWGGYDQEIRSELQWQRASILAPKNCSKLLSKLEVSDALCAAVESRGTVTGIGGPLLCKNNDLWSAVGVAVWRHNLVLVLPQREWVIRNMISLGIP